MKHRQSKALGNPADLRHVEELPPDRVDLLERRVAELERKVNTLFRSNRGTIAAPREAPATQPSKPQPRQAPTAEPSKPQSLSDKEIQTKQKAKRNNEQALARFRTLMSDGERRTADQIREALDISKGMWKRVRLLCTELTDDDNKNGDMRLYWIDGESEGI